MFLAIIFNNNDIFRLTSCGKLLITNHNYSGIDLFDSSLKNLHYISITQNYTAWAIYKKYDNSAILIHDPSNITTPENSHQFTLINLSTLEKTTINPGNLANRCFSENYYWQNENMILIEEETDLLYHLDLKTHILQTISSAQAKYLAPDFFEFWLLCKKYNPITVYPEKKLSFLCKTQQT